MVGDTTELAGNWARVRRRVDEACLAAGRDPSSVGILPVSKTFSVTSIRAAMDLGLRRFGENRVQEIRDKSTTLAGSGVQWVVIGQLQTNKARDAARLAGEVQSLDRPELAEALDRWLQREGRTMDVLVQVKTSPEPSKSGLPAEQLGAFLETLRGHGTLHVRGLMTLAVQSERAAEVSSCFRRLRELRDEMEALGHSLPRLSMGMSGDFPLAIVEGATEVRIGTAIFGGRA